MGGMAAPHPGGLGSLLSPRFFHYNSMAQHPAAMPQSIARPYLSQVGKPVMAGGRIGGGYGGGMRGLLR